MAKGFIMHFKAAHDHIHSTWDLVVAFLRGKNLLPKSVFLSNFLVEDGSLFLLTRGGGEAGWGRRTGGRGEKGKEKDPPKQRILTMLFFSVCVVFRAWVLLQEKGKRREFE